MDLDLVPTRISSLEPDPLLMITPEKPPSLLKNKLLSKTQPNIAVPNMHHLQSVPEEDVKMHKDDSHLLPLDPALLVTPEKPISLLKNRKQSNEVVDKAHTKNKVRFNVPDSSDDTSDSYLNSNANSGADFTSTSNEIEEGSSTTFTDDTLDFSTKAALYTRRNPLADITDGSNQTFELSTTDSSSSNLTLGSMASIPCVDTKQTDPVKVVDLRNQVDVKRLPANKSNIIDVSAQKNLPIYKTKLSTKVGHRKITPAQNKINEITADDTTPHTDNLKSGVKIGTFLKKKSGLQRHEHSVTYSDKVEGSPPCNLRQPKYNSSVSAGQSLQCLKDEGFDAVTAVKKKIKDDEELRTHVSVKSATGTNIDPEEQLFSNLISLDIPLSDSMGSSDFKRVRRHHTKVGSSVEPNIFSMFPSNLVREKLFLDSTCYIPPEPKAVQAPIDSVMTMYQYSLCWDTLNSS